MSLRRKFSKKKTFDSASRQSSKDDDNSGGLSLDSPASDHFKLPLPVITLVGKAEEVVSSQIVTEYWPTILKALEWHLIWILCWFGFGYGWLLFLLTAFHLSSLNKMTGPIRDAHEFQAKTEKEVLSDTFAALPSWVAFPDFDRMEWVNKILDQMWPNVDSYATLFVKTFIEPKLHNILDLMQLNQVSGFQIKAVELGSIPARVNGIKVYDKTRAGSSDATAVQEVLLDCDISYQGDARVIFTLQGISAQIHSIKFRGMARIHLKPLLNRFPFIGGFEIYFLQTPQLEYGLGGIGTFGEVPGISALVRSIVLDKIRSRFVWPNKFKLYLPMPTQANYFHQPSEANSTTGSVGSAGDINAEADGLAEKWSFLLPRPAGLLVVQLVEARDLLKKDKHFGGSGKSDPYAVVSIGERKMSFRSQYAAKTVNPVWNYQTSFLMENPEGQSMKIEVFDWDSSSADDFLGVTEVSLDNIVSTLDDHKVDRWIPLSDVKHGDIHLVCEWRPAKPIPPSVALLSTARRISGSVPHDTDHQASTKSSEAEKKFKTIVVSLFVDRCTSLSGGASVNSSSGNRSSHLYPRLRISLNGRSDDEFLTLPKSKTENPLFEQGWMMTSNDPWQDKLQVEVVDVKGIDTAMGKVQVPLNFLMELPNQEFFDKEFPLEGGHQNARISMSAKLFSI